VVVSPLGEIPLHHVENIKGHGGFERINSLTDPTFQNWFYYAPTSALGGREWLVDFSRIQSVRLSKLRSAPKLVELNSVARNALRLKLHLFFCRPEEEGIPIPSADR
jgi:hypothetical protein